MPSARTDAPSRKHITKVQIKPLLKRISRDGSPSTSIDLSRSSFEQEGLGIYTSYEEDSVQNDLYTHFPARRNMSDFHRRSTSGTSQLSIASSSSMGKPGSQNVHPMRLAPRTYTPPVAVHCSQTSYFESDGSQKVESAEGDRSIHSNLEGRDQYIVSGSKPRLSLHVQDNPFAPLPGASQTNVTGRASFGYSRDNNSSTLDTASPTSRSSLDFVFRSRTRTSMDPVSRAATIQAARQAFEEKEAAKNRKFEQQQMKAEERQMKRKEKQGHQPSLKEGDIQEKGWEHDTGSENSNSQDTSQSSHLPTYPAPKSGNWKSKSKSTWMLFLTWLRTRIFKFRRKLRSMS
ncbi:hypothetical protein BJX61DRAFT_148246 [Aspergillus egyptiacus]|nr:hypothetical protein BJX61DRAFT_148246 [Aspergillus egyptiacus]